MVRKFGNTGDFQPFCSSGEIDLEVKNDVNW